jgi:hypothetical protein
LRELLHQFGQRRAACSNKVLHGFIHKDFLYKQMLCLLRFLISKECVRSRSTPWQELDGPSPRAWVPLTEEQYRTLMKRPIPARVGAMHVG